jgi:hypothetical protein
VFEWAAIAFVRPGSWQARLIVSGALQQSKAVLGCQERAAERHVCCLLSKDVYAT